MAPISILLIVVGVAVLPIVENAPSTIVKTPTTEDLRSRVIFIDPDSDDTAKISVARSIEYGRAAQNTPVVQLKSPEPSAITKMDDERQIWGIAIENKDLEEDESYYNRPLNLHKKVTKFSSPNKKLDVGGQQKVQTPVSAPKPSECDFSIVTCCGDMSKVKECFKSRGCVNATDDMFPRLCSSDSVNKIIQDLAKYYKGNQET